MSSADTKVYFDIRVRLDGQETLCRVHGNEFIVGAGADVDVRVVHDALSEKHLHVRILPDGGLAVADLGSAKGTRHGSQVLAPFKFYRYAAGKPLGIGIHEIRLEMTRTIEVPPDLVAQAETTAKEILDAAERDMVEILQRQSRAERKIRRLQRLEKLQREAIQDFAAHQARRAEERGRVEELEAARVALEAKLAEGETALRELSSEREAKAAEVVRETTLLEEIRVEAERLTEARRETRELETEQIDLRARIAAASKDLFGVEERRISLLTQVDHAWIAAERARSELDGLREKLDGLRQEWDEKRRECEDFRAETARAETRVQDLRAEIASNEPRARELSETIKTQAPEARRLNEEVARLATEEADRQARIERARTEEEELTRHLERLQGESGDLRRQLEIAAAQLRDAERQLLEARDEWKGLSKALPAVREEIDAAREEAKRVRNETAMWVQTQRTDLEKESQHRIDEATRRLESEIGERRRREESELRSARIAFESEVSSRVPEQKRLLMLNLKALYMEHISANPVWGLKAEEVRPRFLDAAEATLVPILEIEKTPRSRSRYAQWTRWGLIGGAPVAALLLAFAFFSSTGLRGSVRGFLSRHPASAELFVERVREERKKTRSFRPTQDNRFRPTYTENLVFLEGYLPLKLDPGLRVVWAKAVRRFCTEELTLPEVSANDFLGQEESLLRELAKLREEIRPEASEADIARMRDVESQSQKAFERVLGGVVNIRKLKAFETDFYRKYSEILEREDAPDLR